MSFFISHSPTAVEEDIGEGRGTEDHIVVVGTMVAAASLADKEEVPIEAAEVVAIVLAGEKPEDLAQPRYYIHSVAAELEEDLAGKAGQVVGMLAWEQVPLKPQHPGRLVRRSRWTPLLTGSAGHFGHDRHPRVLPSIDRFPSGEPEHQPPRPVLTLQGGKR